MNRRTWHRFWMAAGGFLLLLVTAGTVLAGGETVARILTPASGGPVSAGSTQVQTTIGLPVAGITGTSKVAVCTGACGQTVPPVQVGGTVTVTVSDFTFAPQTVEIEVGDTVVWKRVSGSHNVVADNGSFSSGPPSNTWTLFQHTFNSPGSIGYHCTVHGGPGAGMFGTVSVRVKDTTSGAAYLPLVRR